MWVARTIWRPEGRISQNMKRRALTRLETVDTERVTRWQETAEGGMS